MELIKKGTMGRELGKKDMVFCLIYCEDATPYENYDYFLLSKDIKQVNSANMICPMVLSQMRWDGKLGFPGGNVEPHHKNLVEAIKAELEEEINFTDVDESKLELLATFANEKRHITSFAYKVSYNEFKEIYRKSLTATHFISENVGSVMLQLHEASFNNLMKQTFSGTGKSELELLVKEKNLLINQEMLDKAIELAKKHFSHIKRNNGNNYFEEHIMGTVNLTRVYPLEIQILMALHDVLEDTDLTRDELLKDYPNIIVDSVEALTLDKTAEDMLQEVGKCKLNNMTYIGRFADRLNNLQTTSYKYNDKVFVDKMIFNTKEYFLPHFDGVEKLLLEKELERIISEK